MALCCGEWTPLLPNLVFCGQETPSSLSLHAYGIPLQQSMGCWHWGHARGSVRVPSSTPAPEDGHSRQVQ